MTALTHDLVGAYAVAIANEVMISNDETSSDKRWEAAKTRVRETRARLIDHLEKLEEMAMPAKGRG